MYEFINVDMEKCSGCRICEYACSMVKGNAFNPSRSRIRVVRIYPHTNAALNCRLCEDAPCIQACPCKALSRNKTNGIIIVDDQLCDGCGWCIKACKFGSIALDPKPTVRICDLCTEREKGPACIEWCPEDALELTTNDRLAQKARINSINLLEQAVE